MKNLLTLLGIVVLLVLVIGFYGYAASRVDPVSWTAGPNPGFTGEFAHNNKLGETEFLLSGAGIGPEDVTLGPDNLFYVGYNDGRIVRFNATGQHSDFANTEGRPLGLEFDAAGNLIVADARRGLLSISSEAEVTVLTNAVNGEPLLFVDDLDIAADGTIYFSDASTHHAFSESIYIFIEADHSGRLLAYEPASGETTVQLDGLFFANGIAVGPDEQYVLIAETGAGRISRYWLAGSKQGERDFFFDGFPAAPDNISFNGKDTFWVAFAGVRDREFEALSDKPLLRRFIGALPRKSLMREISHYAFIVGLDLNGNVAHNLQDPQSRIGTLTSAKQFGDKLMIGSLATDAVGIYSLATD